MILLYSLIISFGAVAYTLFLICGESRLFAAVMALAAAFLPMHVMLT